MEEVVLYTTGCPKCKVLEAKLNAADVKYSVITDVDVMLDKGMMSAPCLEVNNVIMDFSTANKWINERGQSYGN